MRPETLEAIARRISRMAEGCDEAFAIASRVVGGDATEATEPEPDATITALVDGLLARIEADVRQQSVRVGAALRASKRTLTADERARLNAQLAEIQTSIQEELAQLASEQDIAERELVGWIERAASVAPRYPALADQARERADEWITRISALEVQRGELEAQLRDLDELRRS